MGLSTRGEGRGGFQTGFGQETLREGWQGSVRHIEFDALDAVHGKEDDRGGERFTISDHHGQVLKRGQFSSTEAQAFGGEGENHPPEFFPRIAQRCDHQCSGGEGFAPDRSRFVLLHGKIVAGSGAHLQIQPGGRIRHKVGAGIELRYAERRLSWGVQFW